MIKLEYEVVIQIPIAEVYAYGNNSQNTKIYQLRIE